MGVKTVRNRIHAGGFKSMVPAKKPELTQRHKDARLAFSVANTQWRRVMFSDESRFYLLAAAQRTACSSYSDT